MEYNFSEVGLNALKEAYYENYNNDNRLPELFELIDEDKLHEWFCGQFERDFTYGELVEMFGECN